MAIATDLGIDPSAVALRDGESRSRRVRWTQVLIANPAAIVSAVFLLLVILAAAFAP
ncbi:MAG: hypothetical protein K0Q89_2962, partial [Thermomicrobiales bacterium]|nr:hypothetical protein [Thermomicrobiales bacterium]